MATSPTKPNAGPALTFTPYAWAKMLWLRDREPENEVGMFALTPESNPLNVVDVWVPPQEVSPASVEFDDDGLANGIADFAEEGISPKNSARIWIHTHPMMTPSPSPTDYETFLNVLEGVDWAIMFIVDSTGQTHCEMRAVLPTGGTHTFTLPVRIDWTDLAGPDELAEWEAEFTENVEEELPQPQWAGHPSVQTGYGYGPGVGPLGRFPGGTVAPAGDDPNDLTEDELNELLGIESDGEAEKGESE